jgi:beta/gamma crystallin
MTNSRRTKLGFAVAAALSLVAASAAAGQLTLYARPGFQGQNMTTTTGLPNLPRSAFNDVASSAIVVDGTWEACTEAYYRGRCAQIVPGNYSNLGSPLNGMVASVRLISDSPAPARIVLNPDSPAVVVNSIPAPVVVNPAPVVVNPDPVVVAAPVVTGVPIPAGARATLYQHTGHLTRVVELTASIDDLDRRNFDDSADAALISGGVWRLCDRERGRGACADFSPGKYDTLGAMNGRVRSAYLIAPVQERVATLAALPPGRAIVYEFPNYGGAPAVIEYGRAPDMDWAYFKNPATSVRIESGSWLVCSDIGYQGECRVLEPGDYPVLTGLGLRGIASARQVWRPEYGSLDLRRQSTP